MSYTRREFVRVSTRLLFASSLLKTSSLLGGEATVQAQTPIKAIAFDAFPIFDPRPIFALVKELYPEQGRDFSVLWRTRIFEYTWLRTSAGRYRDFWTCIEDALLHTARQLDLKLSVQEQAKLMNAFLDLKAYPDVKPALAELRSAGIKLAFLSNMTENMLQQAIQNAELQGYFDQILSTDRVKTFKPDPRAYQMALDAYALRREEIAFVAFASWDAIGAKWFGFPTVWVNRLNFKAEAFRTQPDVVGRNLTALLHFVQGSKKT